jgi:hypothetical protein
MKRKKQSMSRNTTDNEICVDQALPKRLFYEKLYHLAHSHGLMASIGVKTTAVKLNDGNIMTDGLCGFAWVILPDGRKGFARWINKNGLGCIYKGQGVWISAKVEISSLAKTSIQSIDRCNAYVIAFSNVLQANGVKCYVKSSVD